MQLHLHTHKQLSVKIQLHVPVQSFQNEGECSEAQRKN